MMALPSNAAKHLVFKNVEINGSVEDVKNALSKKGFKYEENNNRVPLMIGSFAGYSDVEVNIIPQASSDKVCAIRAELPPRLSWVKLENDYTGLKDKLKRKYGNPVEEVETFSGSKPEDSSAKLVALIVNNCTYRSVFECKEGKITLFLKHQGPICYVALLYEDRINSEESEKTVMSEL